MAPTRLQAQITHRKMRKASWQPGVGHFPGTAVANSLSADIQPHPVRFCEEKKKGGFKNHLSKRVKPITANTLYVIFLFPHVKGGLMDLYFEK